MTFQEFKTIEEAAENYSIGKSSSPVFRQSHKKDFIEGAKWMQERIYYREEVDRLLDTLLDCNMCSILGDEYIQEFKEKKL